MKTLNFTYKNESLEKNTSEKPEIQKLKDGLQLIMGNKEEKSIKRLVCQLTINFNNSFMISINIDCFLVPFDFKFEVYDYNNKSFNTNLDIYLKPEFNKNNYEIRTNIYLYIFKLFYLIFLIKEMLNYINKKVSILL